MLVALTFAASQARAESLEVRWDAPVECPSAKELREEVERLTGRVFERVTADLAPEHADLYVHGSVSAGPDGLWRLNLDIRGREQAAERQITSQSCYEIGQAAASIIALAVDPLADPPSTVKESDERRTLAEKTASQPARQRNVADVEQDNPKRLEVGPARGSSLSGMARISGGADAVGLPAPTPLLEAAAGLAIGDNLHVEGLFGYFVPQRSEMNGSSADVSLWLGAAAACWTQPIGAAFRIGPCAGWELGRRHVQVAPGATSGEASRLWSAPTASLRLAQALGGYFWLPLELQVAIPLRRERFYIEGQGDVSQAPVLTLRAIVGFEVRGQ